MDYTELLSECFPFLQELVAATAETCSCTHEGDRTKKFYILHVVVVLE